MGKAASVVSHTRLREFISDVLGALGMPRHIVEPTAEGEKRIYTAGEPEAECERRRRVEGIPLAPALFTQLNEIAREMGVSPLA